MRDYYIAEIIEQLKSDEDKQSVLRASVELVTDAQHLEAFSRIGYHMAAMLGYAFRSMDGSGEFVEALEYMQQQPESFSLSRQCYIYILKAIQDDNDAAAVEAVKLFFRCVPGDKDIASFVTDAINRTGNHEQTNTADVPQVEPSASV